MHTAERLDQPARGRRLGLGAACAVLLAACTVGPDYRARTPAELGIPERWSTALPNAKGEDLTAWWHWFDDPGLSRLVEDAASHNLDIAQAVARLREAREQLVISRASLYPSLGATADASRDETLRGQREREVLPDGTVTRATRSGVNTYSLGLDASYQLDLFGGVRRSVESARANLEAVAFDKAATQISVEAETARNYVLARAAQARLENARASLRIQDDNLEIAGFRVKAGLVSSLDVEQARASREQTAASIAPIEQQYEAAVARLGVLTGQAPEALKALLATPKPIPRAPEALDIGMPVNLLRRRPDVRAAERALAAATAQIGVAEAQLYPNLSLSGFINTDQAPGLGGLFDTITSAVFAQVSQQIFDAGARRAQVRSQRAVADGAFAAYRLTILHALEDVENAVQALQAARARERSFAEAYNAANNSAIIARSQYRTGLSDFVTLNTQEAALVAARDGLVQARADEAAALIALYAAAGGGWDWKAVPGTEPDLSPASPGAGQGASERASHGASQGASHGASQGAIKP